MIIINMIIFYLTDPNSTGLSRIVTCHGLHIVQGRAVRDMQRGPDHPAGKHIFR